MRLRCSSVVQGGVGQGLAGTPPPRGGAVAEGTFAFLVIEGRSPRGESKKICSARGTRGANPKRVRSLTDTIPFGLASCLCGWHFASAAGRAGGSRRVSRNACACGAL